MFATPSSHNREIVGHRLASNSPGIALLEEVGSVGEFRAMSPLPPDAQLIIDEAVAGVGRLGTTIVDDLVNAGLTRDLPNWLGVMEIGHYRRGDTGHAMRSMDIDVRDERAVPDRDRVIIPVFATHESFSFSIRELRQSERLGMPFDTEMIEQATYNCNVAIEDQTINGAGFAVDGNTAPGLLTSPANAFQYTGTNKAWNHASKTPAEILADVSGMLAMARADLKFGPFNFYYPPDYADVLNKNYVEGTTVFDMTVLERLEKLRAGNNRPITFKQADMLPAHRTILLQMDNKTIDVIVGQTPASLSWASGSGMRRFYMVLACMITRIKADKDGKSGIVVGNV